MRYWRIWNAKYYTTKDDFLGGGKEDMAYEASGPQLQSELRWLERELQSGQARQ